MKKIFLCLMMLFAMTAQAVPAYPELIAFRQPRDGKTVNIYLKGDERVHWAETEDGYSLLHSDDGSFVFAMRGTNGDMLPSPYLAANKGERDPETEIFLSTVPKHLHYSKSQVESLTSIWKRVEDAKKGPKTMSDVIGEKKFLLILFEFSDFHFTHSKNEFAALMNQVNYTADGRTGSVRDYYYDVSGGLFTLNMDVVGPFRGTQNLAFYGSTDEGSQYFAREAVDSAAKYVNFSDYDNDGDGYIDGLHIIFAGFGEEAGASSDHIWSHKWNLWDAPTYNNTVVDVYSCSPELNGNLGQTITAIGVICHELGHVFGAPDYYDTDYGGSGGEFPGLGKWDIMSGGSWNAGGTTPAHHNPYTKIYIYHWVTCTTLTNTAAQYVLDPVAVSNSDFYRVNTSTSGDFFLLENRQNIKWDEAIPGHGMLVYHIHPNANGAHVQNYRHPQQIYILAKTNNNQYPTNSPTSYGSLNATTAPFPGTANRDSLTDNSTPWFRPWSAQPNNMPLYNIADDPVTGKVYFSVQDVSPDPMGAYTEGIDRDKILLSWTRYGTYRTLVLINSSQTPTATPDAHTQLGDTLLDGSIVIYFGNGNSTVVSDLEQGTNYHFKLFTQRINGIFSDGITTDGTTLNCEVGEWRSEDFESSTVNQLPDCWTGDWRTEELQGQHALVSNPNPSPSSPSWITVTSRPFIFEHTASRVLQYSAHFMDGCGEQTKLKVEFQPTPYNNWSVIDSLTYNNDLDEWNVRYLLLQAEADYGRLHFSLFADGNARAAIDNIQITDSWVINSRASNGGRIEPSGYTAVPWGDSIEYIITPNPGCEVHRLVYDTRVILRSRLTPLGDGRYSYKVAENSGMHNIEASFSRSTGVEQATASAISIYPNPTNGKLTVTCEPGSLIRLYDTRGSLVTSLTASTDTTTLDLNDLPKGIYILNCNGVQSFKVVKQ